MWSEHEKGIYDIVLWLPASSKNRGKNTSKRRIDEGRRSFARSHSVSSVFFLDKSFKQNVKFKANKRQIKIFIYFVYFGIFSCIRLERNLTLSLFAYPEGYINNGWGTNVNAIQLFICPNTNLTTIQGEICNHNFFFFHSPLRELLKTS